MARECYKNVKDGVKVELNSILIALIETHPEIHSVNLNALNQPAFKRRYKALKSLSRSMLVPQSSFDATL